ncbi:Hypothetical predicted protein [Pelobates cultripes]|uniref:Uncharacterized protein n=1 Tax=Pelobates cultripes TaxID=61616 RepID=A0AAD1SH15_PELCU|nr:Hypothetical predicted protein [Pelobates cultripes]
MQQKGDTNPNRQGQRQDAQPKKADVRRRQGFKYPSKVGKQREPPKPRTRPPQTRQVQRRGAATALGRCIRSCLGPRQAILIRHTAWMELHPAPTATQNSPRDTSIHTPRGSHQRHHLPQGILTKARQGIG